jgi:hypothetical protein
MPQPSRQVNTGGYGELPACRPVAGRAGPESDHRSQRKARRDNQEAPK